MESYHRVGYRLKSTLLLIAQNRFCTITRCCIRLTKFDLHHCHVSQVVWYQRHNVQHNYFHPCLQTKVKPQGGEVMSVAVTRRMEGEPPSGSRFTKNLKTSYQSEATNTPFAMLVLQKSKKCARFCVIKSERKN